MRYTMTCKPCFTSDDNNHYWRLYMECNCEFICYNSNFYRCSWYYNKFNNNIIYELVISSIYNYDTWTCKIMIFAFGYDFLSLIFKNYYRFIFTWIIWLRNLFHHLSNIYEWNNNISLKAIKLRKFVTGVTELKTIMQKHQGKARDGGCLL